MSRFWPPYNAIVAVRKTKTKRSKFFCHLTANECLPEFNQNNSRNAGALIVAAYVANRSGFDRDGNPTNECGNEWGAYDLGLQNQNLLLAARDSGFDTLIMGIRNAEKLREMLGIPEDQHVMSVIAVGKRAAEPQKPERKNTEDIVKMF